MNKVKSRNLLILIHLYLAAILAPSFILVGVSGAMDLLDIERPVEESPIKLPDNIAINSESPTLEADIAKILTDAGVELDFEYIKNRGDTLTTRPTSRTFAEFKKSDAGWTATLTKPGINFAMMEMHKGHGPKLFRYFQAAAGITLFFVVIAGLFIGLLSKAYRGKTVMALAVGAGAFVLVGIII